MTGKKVYVIGVGMTKFCKPGKEPDFDYPVMVKQAVSAALKDANITFNDVNQAVCAYVYGDSTCGQRSLYELGMTGIPIYNVNNNCATGSSALVLAHHLVAGNRAQCVLAVGFEKMQPGSLSSQFSDRTNPMDKHVEVMSETFGIDAAPITAQMFGNAAREHMKKYGTKPIHLAKIAYKNHKHSTKNPNSQFTQEYTLEEIQKSPMVHDPLTKLQCCPTSDGGAAAILASEEFVRAHHLEGQAVEIIGITMATDMPSTFQEKSCMKMVGYDMSANAAREVYRQSHTKPEDYQVVELHDCFSANELITYEALGLCRPGEAGAFIDRGDNTYGGKFVVNPSGGLISKGHPLGATGLAQCAELCWQLRGLAGERQVANCVRALQHNIGLGGAAVVAAYRLGFPAASKKPASPPTSNAGADVTRPGFESSAIFTEISKAIAAKGPEIVKQVQGVIGFQVRNEKGENATWLVDCKNGSGSVKTDGSAKADCTLVIGDKDLVAVMTGKLNPQQAFFQGKLKITGNMGLAMKLKTLQTQMESMRARM